MHLERIQAARIQAIPVRLLTIALSATTLGVLSPLLHATEDEPPIGRIIFSESERIAIDQLRIRPGGLPNQALTSTARPLRFNGVMQIHGGANRAWINGSPIDRNGDPQRRIRLHGQRLIVTDESGQSVLLPGDSISQRMVTPSSQQLPVKHQLVR